MLHSLSAFSLLLWARALPVGPTVQHSVARSAAMEPVHEPSSSEIDTSLGPRPTSYPTSQPHTNLATPLIACHAEWLVAYDGRVVMSLVGVLLVLPLCCLRRMRSVRSLHPKTWKRTKLWSLHHSGPN